jgi:chloride channel protein, CIC family
MNGLPAPGLLRLAVVAGVGGALTGVVGAAFRLTLDGAERARAGVVGWAQQWPAGWLIPVALAAILVAAAYWLVQRFAPAAAGSGIQHVEAVMRGEAAPAPPAVLPVKFVGGTLALGSGLALGREGPTVQMGATIGAALAARARLGDGDIRTIQSAAAGAGLAVAFNAPIGGIAFVFEELARRFSTEVMVATLAASGAGVLVARALLGDTIEFAVVAPAEPFLAVVAASLVLGALLGALGAAYNRAIVVGLGRFAGMPVPGTARAALVGAVVGLIAWFDPGVTGGGESIVQRVFDGGNTLTALTAVLGVRWLLGPFSYAAGTPGGLFAPLLAVGALAGSVFAQVVAIVAPAVAPEPTLAAIVGMAAFFTAVVRSPLTGIVLVLGMTGTVTPILPVVAASLAAMIVPTLLGSAPIYDTLRERMEDSGNRQSRPGTPAIGGSSSTAVGDEKG